VVKAFGFPITAMTRDVGDHGDLLPDHPRKNEIMLPVLLVFLLAQIG
jgi:hypothetical protein